MGTTVPPIRASHDMSSHKDVDTRRGFDERARECYNKNDSRASMVAIGNNGNGGNSGISGNSGNATLTPAERLKLKMRKALNKQIKSDKQSVTKRADTHRADEDYDTDRKARGERESASLGGALAGGATDRYFSSLNQHHQN